MVAKLKELDREKGRLLAAAEEVDRQKKELLAVVQRMLVEQNQELAGTGLVPSAKEARPTREEAPGHEMEKKLDRILKRLDDLEKRLSGTAAPPLSPQNPY
jgi:hypothetical protein